MHIANVEVILGLASTPLKNIGLKTGAASLAAIGGSAGLKALGISAVRHVGGKWIATRAGLYVAGTLGAPAAGVVAAPLVATGLAVISVALLAASVVTASRGL